MTDVERVFTALGDGVRRHVVERLAAEPTVTAAQLATELPITRQAVAKHLAALSDAGLVSVERVGREARYRLEPDALREAGDWLGDVERRWDQRLGRLKRAAER